MSGRDERATVVATASAAGGLGLGGALAVLFVAFKLSGIISWSWWWVLAPAWIPGSLVLLILVAATILFVGAGLAEANARERRWRERTGQPPAHRHGPAYRWGRRTR